MRGVVYGRSLETAQAKLQEIVNDYIHYNIATTSTRKHSRWHGDVVEFSNGDIWEACVPSKNIRGKKYNVAYIDKFIGVDLLDEVIMPSLVVPPFQAWRKF